MVIVLVYNDTGTSLIDILMKALDYTLHKIQLDGKISEYKIETVLADEIINGTCLDNADIFIIPGGRDLPYVEKLAGLGTIKIRNFVQNGGRYLGICAGAYFGSRFCEFEKGTPLEVCGERELAFFPGKAKGCVYPGFKYNSENGARIVYVEINYPQIKSTSQQRDTSFPAYYNGGCQFIAENSMKTSETDIIAKYDDNEDRIAIVLCNHGKGKALLSGVHPEINYKFIEDGESMYSKEQLQGFEKASEKHQLLFEYLIQLIL